MEKDDSRVVLYPKTSKYVFFAIFCFAFLLLSGLLTLIGFKITLGILDTTIKEGYSHNFIAITGILGLLMFIPLTVYFTGRLIKKKPSVIIDEVGIYDNASTTAAGYIEWDRIENAKVFKQVYKMSSQKILGINLKDKDEFVKRFRGVKKFLVRTGDYPVCIPQNGINIDIEVLYEKVSEHLRNVARK